MRPWGMVHIRSARVEDARAILDLYVRARTSYYRGFLSDDVIAEQNDRRPTAMFGLSSGVEFGAPGLTVRDCWVCHDRHLSRTGSGLLGHSRAVPDSYLFRSR